MNESGLNLHHLYSFGTSVGASEVMHQLSKQLGQTSLQKRTEQVKKDILRNANSRLFSVYVRRDNREEMLENFLDGWQDEYLDLVKYPNLDRRLNLALERLQKKGRCREKSLKELCESIIDLMPEAYYTLGLMPPDFQYLTCHKGIIDEQIAKCGRDLWKQSIEICLMALEPREFCNFERTSLVPLCEDHIKEIYMTFFHRAVIATYATNNYLTDEAKNNSKEARRLMKKARALLEQAEAKTATFEITAAQAREQSAKAIERLEREKKALEKELYELRRQNELLQLTLEASSEEEDPQEVAEPIEAESEPEPTIEERELYTHIELPEDSSVIFLGGHRNFVKKVQQLHPRWRYFSTYDTRPSDVVYEPGAKITCIVIYSKHLSHKAYQRVTQNLKDVPFLFLDCQNIERGELIMRKEYASKVLGLSEEDLKNKYCG